MHECVWHACGNQKTRKTSFPVLRRNREDKPICLLLERILGDFSLSDSAWTEPDNWPNVSMFSSWAPVIEDCLMNLTIPVGKIKATAMHGFRKVRGLRWWWSSKTSFVSSGMDSSGSQLPRSIMVSITNAMDRLSCLWKLILNLYES